MKVQIQLNPPMEKKQVKSVGMAGEGSNGVLRANLFLECKPLWTSGQNITLKDSSLVPHRITLENNMLKTALLVFCIILLHLTLKF